jgi:hypothetical protein
MRRVIVALLCMTVGGCATEEWMQARSACSEKYLSEIPSDFQQVTVQKSRAVRVPNGVVVCNSTDHGRTTTTTCTEGTRAEYVPYTAVETIDRNKARRDQAIEHCTTSTCYQRYGNADCDVAK